MAKRRAIISVTDKDNLDVLVEGLSRHDYEIVSTGGTAREIRKIVEEKGYDIKVLDAAEVTGFPEMFEGRVKTLHPKIHGAILCRRDNSQDMKEARENSEFTKFWPLPEYRQNHIRWDKRIFDQLKNGIR